MISPYFPPSGLAGEVNIDETIFHPSADALWGRARRIRSKCRRNLKGMKTDWEGEAKKCGRGCKGHGLLLGGVGCQVPGNEDSHPSSYINALRELRAYKGCGILERVEKLKEVKTMFGGK